MKKVWDFIQKRKYLFFVIVALVSLVEGFYLRRIDYSQIPEPYIILDEHSNVWHGLSLRKAGLPAAWSILPAYKDDSLKFGSGGGVDGFNININGVLPSVLNYKMTKSPVFALEEVYLGDGFKNIPIVQPYLDHPPFGALVLSLGENGQTRTFKDLSDHDMRRAAVYLAIVTQLLILVLAYQVSRSYLVTLVASFAYATVPSYLLLSRYAQLENVLSPLLLLVLILLNSIRTRRKRLGGGLLVAILVVAGLFAGLAALTKLAGWIAVVLGAFLLAKWKFSKKHIAFFVVPGALLGLLYFIWGLYLSPRLFLDIFMYQGVSRSFIGSINLLVTAFQVGILHFPFDGWWVGGFLCLLLFSKDNNLISLATASILVLLSALALGGANYPWYFIPLIPFMCVGIGLFFNKLAKDPSVLNVFLAFFVFVSSSFYWGFGVSYAASANNNYQQPFLLYRIVFVFVLALALFLGKIKRFKNFKIVWFTLTIFVLLVLVLLNHYGMHYILDNWGKLPSLYTPGTF